MRQVPSLVGAALAVALAGPVAPAAGEAASRTHRVRAGETLWTIAGLTVGDPTLWPALYLANRDQIKDPARVYPGQELAIPEIAPEEREALRAEAEQLSAP